jgi:hypothetical protein
MTPLQNVVIDAKNKHVQRSRHGSIRLPVAVHVGYGISRYRVTGFNQRPNRFPQDIGSG